MPQRDFPKYLRERMVLGEWGVVNQPKAGRNHDDNAIQ